MRVSRILTNVKLFPYLRWRNIPFDATTQDFPRLEKLAFDQKNIMATCLHKCNEMNVE